MNSILISTCLLFLISSIVSVNAHSRQKRAYTMVDYICHRQPNLSICGQRAIRATSPLPFDNKVNPYDVDSDPMPTPGPLPLGDLQSAYDVARRREQEDPDEEKVHEKKVVKSKEPSDSDLLTSTKEADQDQSEVSTTTSGPEHDDQTEQTTINDSTTQRSLNPRLRYQQYEKALADYYKQYPNYQNYYGQQQQQYQGQYPSYSNQQQQYSQSQYYPQQQYYQQQQYYPQQQYYQQQQPNYYQPNGFNFGIGSQLQIPYAGPIGISTGFGFGGK